MFDLTKLPARYVAQYGVTKLAEVLGTSTSVVSFWVQREDWPLAAVQKLLEGEQYDKAVTALVALAKLEGWTSDQAQLNIFNDLNAKDIEGLKKKLQDKMKVQ